MDLKYGYTHISVINETVAEWYLKQLKNDTELTEADVREKALQINKNLCGDPKFAASSGWYLRWKKEYVDMQRENNTLVNALDIINKPAVKILFIEPFYSGSHKQLIDTLANEFTETSELVTLSGKKWPWRARCSALTLSQLIPRINSYTVLFCSSVLNLAELLGIRPDLQKLKKVVYFHENQLVYPKKEIKERDIQYGYNQITTCLAADHVIFNSSYNMNSFLYNINSFLKLLPDCRPKNLITDIKPRSSVIYGPIQFSNIPTYPKSYKTLHIVWPHRWEFDKNPEDFFSVLFQMKALNASFRLSVLGESFSQIPEIFDKAKDALKDDIENWGYIKSKEDYYRILSSGNVVISTAIHEFYGVAM